MNQTKPFEISKAQVWRAWKQVKSNRGAPGVDGETIAAFESNLKDNLYCLWNRLASGSYFPSPVKAVSIKKKSGGERILGIPTVSDRIAQTLVTQYLTPLIDPHFHEDSYGYRPGKSAHQALRITRDRCLKLNWVLEYDIRGLFDNIDHELLHKALLRHCDEAWVKLYVERWLTVPMQQADGSLLERNRGTPQGGPISALLSNLFLHYVLDQWLVKHHPGVLFSRYADDGIIHCRTQTQAQSLYEEIERRLVECGLEIHPDKSRIVYCKDGTRREDHDEIQFDFLGYTFRPRRAFNRRTGKAFCRFLPAPSREALKSMTQKVRRWKLQLKSSMSLEELSAEYDPIISGWVGYYSCFGHWQVRQSIGRHLDKALMRWAKRKFKSLRHRYRKVADWLNSKRSAQVYLFAHW